jgi:protein-S-isoprenylcysteine O-methyltransferase Ste14
MILELLAFGLITNAAYTIAVVAIIFVPTLFFRIRMEETALVAKLGDAYRNYQMNTPALFPYKLPQAK